MQTPRKSLTRNGSSEVSLRASAVTPRSARQTNTLVSESDSVTTACPNTKTLGNNRSPKAIDHRSPKSSASEKKRSSRTSELESQISQLQEDLKKTKDQLASSELGRRKAQQEVEETMKHFMAATAELEDCQRQVHELSESEDDRVQELWKIGQERDRAWQSELEAIQKQHLVDSNALASAMNEIQRLRLQLEMVMSSEATQKKKVELANSELHTLKQDMEETLSLIETFRSQLEESERSEAEYQELVNESHMQLEMAKSTIDTLRSEGLKVMESFKLVSMELEKSKARVSSLEEEVRKLQSDNQVIGGSSMPHHPENHEPPVRSELKLLHSKAEQLKSDLEASVIRYQEEQVKCTVQIQSACEAVERIKMESGLREAELESALKEAKAEILELKENLLGKEALKDLNERPDAEPNKNDSELESKLRKSMEDVTNLKANLVDKETELHSVLKENKSLKLDIEKKQAEMIRSHESAKAEIDRACAAEQDAMIRIGIVTQETDKSNRKVEKISELLEAAQAANSEMEVELRRLRVQSEQWRKAAEAAASIFVNGNDDRFVERTGSLDSDYQSVGGKLTSSPFYDDMDDESQKKKSMLKKIGVLWKKGQK